MADIHHLRVFTDTNGEFGDAASVVIDEGRHITDSRRQALTRRLGTGETTFVNDLLGPNITIMHYTGEVGFAGVAVLGTAWLLTQLRRKPTESMQGRNGLISTWQEGELTWARASIATMPPWHHEQLETAGAVERIKREATRAMEHTMVWAWVNEAKGLVRARTFASDWSIPEAEGNGSGSLLLASQLRRNLEIKHGAGSEIFAIRSDAKSAAIGGRVVEDKTVGI
jgi:predicted PhzF superfamily epimerase YddE/YHI9